MEEYFEEDYAADDAENDDDSNGADYFDAIAAEARAAEQSASVHLHRGRASPLPLLPPPLQLARCAPKPSLAAQAAEVEANLAHNAALRAQLIASRYQEARRNSQLTLPPRPQSATVRRSAPAAAAPAPAPEPPRAPGVPLEWVRRTPPAQPLVLSPARQQRPHSAAARRPPSVAAAVDDLQARLERRRQKSAEQLAASSPYLSTSTKGKSKAARKQ